MAILHPGKFLFLCTPHTASVSTTVALENIEGALALDYKHIGIPEIEAGDFRKVSIFRGGETEILFQPRPPSKETYSLSPEVYTGKEVVFSTVRNPYDLIATWWALDRYGFPTLTQFVAELEDHRFAKLDYLVEQGSRFVRYESLEDDLNVLLDEVGLGPIELPQLNKTPTKKPWREYYDRESLDAVNERFAVYFVRYGYEQL